MDSENRGRYDRAVVRALRSLKPLTGPTALERRRIRDRVLIALEAETNGEEPDPLGATVPPSAEEAVPEPRAEAAPPNTTEEPAAADDEAEPADTAPEPDADPESRPAAAKPTSPRHVKARSEKESRPATPRRKVRPDTGRGVLAGARGRLAVASLALLTLVGSLIGMSLLLARDALPGDALYGVKRTAEAASLGLTFGDESKALKHLEFAAARITEIETLARRYPNPADAPVGGYLTALTDFDNDAIAGSRQLITLGTGADGRLLHALRDWAAQQAERLRQVDRLLPQDARTRASASRALLDRITARADALLARMDCYQITSGSFDDVGALPATDRCEEYPAATSGTPRPSVPATPDNPGTATPGGPLTPSPPLPSAEPTPQVPPVPVPGATVSVPAPTLRPSAPNGQTTTTPPVIQLPPLLPGLPPLGIG